MTDHDSPKCRCWNCTWTGPLSAADVEIKDYWSRVDVGGEVPAGECPRCGSLAYLDTPSKAELLGALTVCVNWIENHHPQAGYTRTPACAVAGRRMLDKGAP
jgi:hypothetical protein